MARLKLKFNTARALLTIYMVLLFIAPTTSVNDVQRDYMMRLMRGITPTPSNWSDTKDVCTWSGVDCYFGTVSRINLASMSLKGTIPPGLNDSLIWLTIIDLRDNSLSGPVPSLANLDRLQRLYLDDNNFTSIPHGCFLGLMGLQSLGLSNNVNLPPWRFPAELNDSPALNYLDLSATNLMGSLPNIFHSFPNLQHVFLSNNSLSGVLPESFARSKISSLWLDYQSHNKLSGTIEVLSSMTKLNGASLRGNRFEGPIPALSNCLHLIWLLLDDNQLSGVVPPSLMNLSGLARVYLDNNWLQGPPPVFNSNVEVSLGVNSSNGFCLDHAGPCDERVNTLLQIAAAIGYPLVLARSWRANNPCKGWEFIACDEGGIIRTVNLSRLNLTGNISSAFGNLTGLRNLYLNGNKLQGSIPESLATLPQLQVLDVSHNNLSGNIPKFSKKVKFDATGNAFLGHSQANRTTLWIAGASVACVGVVIIFVVIIYIYKRHYLCFKRTSLLVDNKFDDFMKNYVSSTLKRYNYSEIKRMTNSFCNKLGQGGYGIVYKGSLTDGREVAVKVLSEVDGSSGDEFINEVASISKTFHVNIVSLLGFCYERNMRALIYEFMSNGSLDKFLNKNGSSNASCDIDWNTLFQITINIARGLEYLHRGCNTKILHLDIKPQNILLDEKFSPKIADFGLSTICRKKESIVSIVGTRGTPGYIAPEVFCRTYGGVSHKSDVYSYGMMILEIIGRRNNYDKGGSNASEMYFPDWIYKDLEQDNILTRYMISTEEENEIIMKITLVSLWCIQPNPSNRPSMGKVLEMLEGPLHSISCPPKPVLCSLEMPPLSSSKTSDINIGETISITGIGEASISSNEFTK